MRKETITYTDYKGNNRTETFFFNLSKAEAMELECSVEGGFMEYMKKIVEKQDLPAIMDAFKKLIFISYGEKSDNGRRFIKSDELSKAFSETEAYSILFMKMMTNTGYASEFFNGITPDDIEETKDSPVGIEAYNAVTGNT